MSSLDHAWGERRNSHFPGFKIKAKSKKAQRAEKERMQKLAQMQQNSYQNQGMGGLHGLDRGRDSGWYY